MSKAEAGPEEAQTAITGEGMSELARLFVKDVERWTPADVARAIAYYKEVQANPKAFDLSRWGTGERKVRKKPVRKAKPEAEQIDLEELIAAVEAK
jgi:hypothetical protein